MPRPHAPAAPHRRRGGRREGVAQVLT
ncbi:hypothetical protein E2C01_085296 [Portunus trituberculatus]|uniref:Uncharacterized protein n=1 Tax=Portunus trituberculatus TaxID=210409 RepID=A0A5B7J6D5_PORTR|nr:hypothetical protein [Portunus trituberculatus]